MRDIILSAIAEVQSESKATYFKPVDQVKEDSIKNAIRKYAPHCVLSNVVAIMDTTVFGSGKDGFLLTTRSMFGKDWKQPVRLAGLEKVVPRGKRETYISLTYSDGMTQEVYGSIYASYLCKVLSAIIEKTHKSTAETKVPEAKRVIDEMLAPLEGQPELPKPEPSKPELPKPEPPKSEPPKSEPPKSEPPKQAKPVTGEKNAVEWFKEGVTLAKENNYEGAVPLFTKAAELGLSEAQYTLAICYIKEWGVKKDEEAAAKWAEKAAKKGHEKAKELMQLLCKRWFNRGMEAYKSEDFTAAVKWFTKAAEQGDETAQYNLGIMYSNGIGVPVDKAVALKWHKLAANQGYAEAQYNVGVMYDNGLGTEKDVKEALKWFEKAAEQGSAQAQKIVGNRYLLGVGTEVNIEKGMSWCQKAVAQGDKDAEKLLIGLTIKAYKDAETAFEANKDAEALRWYRVSAELGFPEAQRQVGDMYLVGWGTKENLEEALKWYRRAAEQGNEFAKYIIDTLRVEGRESAALALKINLLAKRGDADSLFILGEFQTDSKKAKEYFEKAAKLGSKQAQEMLRKYRF